MPGYDKLQLLEEIVIDTKSISEILNQEDKLAEDSLSKLDLFYEKRTDKLVEIQKWLENNGLSKLDKKQQIQWDSIYQELLRLEKYNIDLLKNKLDNTAEELKKITKHKALLIYSKEMQ